MGLSCCIIAHNEGDRIERCIRAARGIVDEVVVVDSGSTDDTVAKAEALGAKVFFNAWDGYGPQKRFAEDCAANDWILNLDADEVLTPELAEEIAALMRTPAGLLPAYRFRQVTVYPGHDKPRLWADFHNYVRLYDRRRVRFRHSRVHDTVDTKDFPVGQLQRRRTALLLALAGPRARQAREATPTCRPRSSRSRAGMCWRDCPSNIRSCSFATTSCGGTAPAAGTGLAHRARDRARTLAAAAEDPAPAGVTGGTTCTRTDRVWTMSTTRFRGSRGCSDGAARRLSRPPGARGTKQALGLSRRGDATFYVDRFDRAAAVGPHRRQLRHHGDRQGRRRRLPGAGR